MTAQEFVRRIVNARSGTLRKDGDWFLKIGVDEHTHINLWGRPGLEMPRVRSNPHNHQFGFTSTLLLGAIRDDRFEKVADASGAYRQYLIDRADAGVRFIPTEGRVNLVTPERLLLKAGDTYSMSALEIHSAVVVEPTITFVRRYKNAPMTQYVMAPVSAPLGAERQLRKAPRSSESESWERIEDLCRLAGIAL